MDPEETTTLSNRWAGTIGVEGVLTGDGRLIETEALRWENLPIPIRYVKEDSGAHDGAVVVGHITAISREGKLINAEGDFDLDSEEGREASRQVIEELTTGVSMDLDDVSFEIRVAADLIDGMSEDEPTEVPVAEDGMVKVMEMNSGDEVFVTTDGRIRAATLVAIPAFAEAHIAALDVVDEAEAIVAAASREMAPPKAFFENPHLSEVTALTVTTEGHIFGHLATWGTCHIGLPDCTTPPKNYSDYAYFHTGAIETLEGSEVAVGHITLDTRHAGDRMSAIATANHYENTGAVAADVVAGEDAFGVWVSGSVRGDLSDTKRRALRSAPLSGDWRRIGGSLELVAALSVNVPGFPVPRPRGLVASGNLVSLTAAGMVAPTKVQKDTLTKDDIKYLKRLALRAREFDVHEMALRVKANALVARVRG